MQPEAPMLAPDVTPPGPAISPVPPGGRKVTISHFEIDGNEVISSDELQAQISQYVDRELTLSEIYDVADVLTKYYRDQGYTVATVNVPAQRVSSGTLRLEVVEGRIGAVRFEGNQRFSNTFLERQIDELEVGTVMTNSALEHELLLLNDIPGLSAQAVVGPGDAYGESDLVIRTEEDRIDGLNRPGNIGGSLV